MILCLTPNPAWDVTYRLDRGERLALGASHRVPAPTARAGGKGVNVASVLGGFGEEGLVVAAIGGPTGQVFEADLIARGIPLVPVRSPHETRRSTAVVDDEGATLLNESGAPQPESVWTDLLAVVADRCPEAAAVVISGSLPEDAPVDLVASIVRLARAASLPSVLDVRGPWLTAALAEGPTLVKPNAAEASDTTGLVDPLAAARALVAGGAGAALVSCGADGAVLATHTRALRARGPHVPAGNPTGAGDALCAGVARALAHAGADVDWAESLPEALSWAAAAVHSPVAGTVDPALAARIRPDITLEELA